MKRFLDKTWAKITAFFLFILFAAICAAATAGIVYLVDEQVYLDDGKRMQDSLNDSLCIPYLWEAAVYYRDSENGAVDLSDFNGNISSSPCALVITDTRTGEELARSGSTEGAVYQLSRPADAFPDIVTQRDVTVTAYLPADPVNIDYQYVLLQLLISWRYGLIVVAALSLALALFCLIFQLASAGHWQGHEGIHLTWFDKTPLDVCLLALVGLFALIYDLYDVGQLIRGIIFLLLALLLLPVFAAQCKAGTVWKSTVIYRLLRRLVRRVKWLVRLLGKLPLVWKTALGIAVWLLLNILCIGNAYELEFSILLIVVNLLLGLFLLYLAICLRALQKGGEALANGDMDSRVDTRGMYGDFRRHGEHLNDAQMGVQKAVEERTKSERLKTELITNVSHDIKTPLTSIVNYVDLLKKEEIGNPTAAEYIAVIDRQSQRLRKLTEDLVEASKAATGNVPVNWEDTDMNVLLGQVAGEYTERLAACQLEPILTLSEETPLIRADGRLLWRVLDNLMSNVCKYAMPGTRVYLATAAEGDQVTITVKNISRYALNVSADELTERFVRGDASRSTEGSGLGLSIANSLTALQKGGFALAVDGDLFKATLTFPRIVKE